MDHPPIPGIIPPKTLVVNLTGTLIHTEFVVRYQLKMMIFKLEVNYYSLAKVLKSRKDLV